MNSFIRQAITQNNISVIYTTEIEKNAFCIPDKNIMFVNEDIDEIDCDNAIFHEVGHLTDNEKICKCTAPSVKILNENKADKFMVEQRVKEYMRYFDEYPDYIDINRFLNAYNLESRHYSVAEEIFKEYLIK